MAARDDLEACLQAYRFAELLLGGFASKSRAEREQALASAEQLCSEVQSRYETLVASADRAHVEALQSARARLTQKLADARASGV